MGKKAKLAESVVIAQEAPQEAQAQEAPALQEAQAPLTRVEAQAPLNPQEAQALHEAAVLAEADRLLHKATVSFRAGVKAYGLGMMRAGLLGWKYVSMRMELGHSMKAGYQRLEGEWARYSATEVNVDRIIRASLAQDLFCSASGVKAELIAYVLFRDCWSQLLTREGTVWSIAEPIRQEALAAFTDCAATGKVKDDTLAITKALQGKLAKAQRELAEDKAKAQAKTEQEARQAALVAKVATDKAQRELAEAEKAGLTEKAQEARKEVLAKQLAEQEAIAKAQAEERARVKADAEAKEKAQKEQRALESAREKAQRKQDRETQRELKATSGPIEPLQGTALPVAGLAGMAKQGTAKDIAGMMMELLTGGDEPDSVFEEFLNMARVCGELSTPYVIGIESLFKTANELIAVNKARKEETVKVA